MGSQMTAVRCENLGEVRANIDRLDHEIVKRLAERQNYVIQAARFKRTKAEVPAPERVEEVVSNVRRLAEDYAASPDVVERGYRALIAGFIQTELAAHSGLK